MPYRAPVTNFSSEGRARGEGIGSTNNRKEVCHVISSHSLNGQQNEAMLLCEEAVEPSYFCLSTWSQFCQRNWIPNEDLTQEIHREVARAIG